MDVVVDAFPAVGQLFPEMEVDLYVSKGPRPTHAEVPNLVGESLALQKEN